ncbi:MAG TPA: hypothetical protein VGX76_10625 [Pirellulales bacterium]|jgi:hypothetical protein|nr:hypothetical protein [Pirellulales bacterium]
MRAPCYEVEFIGGPFDGHRQPISIPPTALASMAAFPISRNIFHLFDNEADEPAAPTTSLAIYELAVVEDQPRYHFLGAAAEALPFAEA